MVGDMDKPVLPHITTGKPQRADGTKDNTPPQSSCLSPSRRTREAFQGMVRGVDSRSGETQDETPMTLNSGGWGVVVRAQESCVHQDED